MKVYLDMIGCRLNQSEIEAMANKIRAQGHQIISSDEEADVVVINTCCVTAKAAADSRKMIRHASKGKAKQIVVTGCWGTLFEDEAQRLPMVTNVISNQHKNELVSILLGSDLNTIPVEEYLMRKPLPGGRHRTRASIKVQDGCSDHCTFCITRLARGKSQSVPLDDIKKDIQNAIRGGVHEIVLTGVQLGAYGNDQSPKRDIKWLLSEITAYAPEVRIRLSSIEPWDIEPSFFDLWENNNLCRHLHIPLQSGSGRVLRRMARRITPEKFSALILSGLNTIPGLAITTDVIVGFPGENDDEFLETLNFIKGIDFAGGHVFTYSAMPETPAANYPGQVDHSVRKERNKIVRHLFAEKSKVFNEKSIGTTHKVLWESAIRNGDLWKLSGLSDNYLRVNSFSVEPRYNVMDKVLITRIDGEGDKVWGEISDK